MEYSTYDIMNRMWNYFVPKESQWYCWKLDGASLWMRKNGEEWRFAASSIPFKQIQNDSEGPLSIDAPKDLPIALAVAAGKKVALRPHPSTAPYLVSARNEVKIYPATEAQFDIALPPIFHIELEDGSSLFECFPFVTPYTWFGDKTSGDLCLSLPIELDPQCKNEQGYFKEIGLNTNISLDPIMQESLRRAAQYLSCRSLIHCKIVVKNKSKEPLDVKRLVIFTSLMNVYLKQDNLISDTVIITATADGSLQTNIDDSAYKNLTKIHIAPKTGLNELLVMKGVSFLRSIAGL